MSVRQCIHLVLVLVLTGVVCRPVSAQSPASGDPNPRAILRKAVGAEFEVALEGEQVTEWGGGRKLLQKVYRKPGGFLRIEWTSGPRQGEVIVRNGGETEWHYRPRPEKIVIQQPVPPLERGKINPEIIRRVGEKMTPVYVGKEEVAGRSAHVIAVQPKNATQPIRKVWVDTEKFVRLKMEQYAPDGTLLRTVRFERVNFNPNFSPGTFDFTPPPDAEEWSVVPRLMELRSKAPFALGVPVYRPPGFQLDNAAVRRVKQNEAAEIWLRYSDKLGNGFSVFQRPLPNNALKPGKPRGGIIWTQDGYQFTIIGALPEPELRRIARSIRLQPFKPSAAADSR